MRFEDVAEPMEFGRDPYEAYGFVHGLTAWMLEGLDGAGRAGALDALRADIAAHRTDRGVHYGSAAGSSAPTGRSAQREGRLAPGREVGQLDAVDPLDPVEAAAARRHQAGGRAVAGGQGQPGGAGRQPQAR